MGQLVFQATLGGQVNLVGPNTASTFNINVPAVAGNMVTTGDTGTVTSTMLSTTTLTASAATTASSNKGAFNYGTLNFSDTGIVQSAQTSVNSYFQNVIQNTSNGASASSEFIAYNDQGTATTNFAAVGINSSGYSGTGSINAPGYAYFLSGSTDLVIGTIGSNKIHFTINSGATDAMTIDTSGNLLLGTTSGTYKITAIGANTASFSGWGSGIGTGLVMTTTVTNANSDAISFNQNATQVGRIQTSSVGTTLYLGTSDSRLKIDNGVCTDTSVIDNTVIHEFTWKQNNVPDRGVFAQEAFLVNPHAVYKGEDTLNEDGSLKSPWGVDYSKYVPDLIVHAQQLKKQVQEQQAMITAQSELITQLQADVADLKAAK